MVLSSLIGPTTGNVHPFCQARSLLAFHVNNIVVASTSAADASVLRSVPIFPVVILLIALGFILGRLLEILAAGKLEAWSIRRAVLNGGMSVPKVAEVVNILRA
jgi:hypothetical protein